MTREDAINKWVIPAIKNTWNEKKCSEIIKALSAEPCDDAIESLPPITSKPKIGHWADDKCSVCGKGTEDLIDSSEWYRNEEPNFCPFCGVKIESEE